MDIKIILFFIFYAIFSICSFICGRVLATSSNEKDRFYGEVFQVPFIVGVIGLIYKIFVLFH